MSEARLNVFQRLFRGETSFDFAGRWRRWFAISGLVIVVGLLSLGLRGLNFSIDFKGGTQWVVPTNASVAQARNAVGNFNPSLRQATILQLTNRQTGQREIEVSAAAKATTNNVEVVGVTGALAKLAKVPSSEVTLNAIGPSWGASISSKALRAVIIFLVACALYIWLRFEGKMAVSALVALLHDILVTVGIYSLSGFQVSPDTVIAFLTILGYSLYDTIVVFDKVQENTRGLASTGRVTYTDTVNLSMNTVLARSLNTSFVAILPILSILVIGAGLLGATALNDFGLALLIGLTTGAYSSIFIASPLLAILKEREARYSQIRQRLAARPAGGRRLTPAAAAAGALQGVPEMAPTGRRPTARPRARGQVAATSATSTALAPGQATGRPAANGNGSGVADTDGLAGASNGAGRGGAGGDGADPRPDGPALFQAPAGTGAPPQAPPAGPGGSQRPPAGPAVPVRPSNRPPPRPRKKRRR